MRGDPGRGVAAWLWGASLVVIAAAGVVAERALRTWSDGGRPHALPIAVLWPTDPRWRAVVIAACALFALLAIAGLQFARALHRMRGRAAVTLLIATQLAVGVILSCCPVTFSSDAYAYAAYGRLYGVHGVSPYRPLNPADARGDPAIADVWNAFFGESIPPDAYGPSWTLLAAAVARVERGASLFVQCWTQRLIAVIAAAAASLGLLVALRRRHPEIGERCRRVALFALNPLVLFETAVGGHNDMIMVALAVWACALVETAPVAAAVLLAGSITVKFVSLLLVPFLALDLAARRGRAHALRFVLVVVGVAALTTVPFWSSAHALTGIAADRGAAGGDGRPALTVGTSPAGIAYNLLVEHGLCSGTVAALAFAGVIGAAAAIGFARYAATRRSGNVCFTVAALLAVSPAYWPWYGLWLSPALVRADAWGRYAWWFLVATGITYATFNTPLAESARLPILTLLWTAPVALTLFVRRRRAAARRAEPGLGGTKRVWS